MRYYLNMKENLNILLKCLLHLIKMIAIGLCGYHNYIFWTFYTYYIINNRYVLCIIFLIYSKLNKMENLVTFKTAQLAKSKGFNEPCEFYLMDSLMNY
jgi:hypothetical protein